MTVAFLFILVHSMSNSMWIDHVTVNYLKNVYITIFGLFSVQSIFHNTTQKNTSKFHNQLTKCDSLVCAFPRPVCDGKSLHQSCCIAPHKLYLCWCCNSSHPSFVFYMWSEQRKPFWLHYNRWSILYIAVFPYEVLKILWRQSSLFEINNFSVG